MRQIVFCKSFDKYDQKGQIEQLWHRKEYSR